MRDSLKIRSLKQCQILDSRRFAFRYCDPSGGITVAANRNGSLNSIAGVYSEGGNVLGMMPHPENFVEDLIGGTDGRGLFDSLAA